MHEFELIARYFSPLTQGEPGAFDLKDDAASLDIPAGHSLIVTKDIMVAGVHFIGNEEASLIARKLLRVNLSDLAAKGARPWRYMLGLSLPRETQELWIASFAEGLTADQALYNIILAGGDTTATDGPLTLSLTAFGLMDTGTMLTRSGAKPGDEIYMSGTLGDAALGLQHLQSPAASGLDRDFLISRYRLPQPRTTLGPALVGIAHSSMDISDGLVQDISHICAASSCGADIDANALPLSPAAAKVLAQDAGILKTILSGGDDYEILFTAPPKAQGMIVELAQRLSIQLSRIGRITADNEVIVRDASGQAIALQHKGFRHF